MMSSPTPLPLDAAASHRRSVSQAAISPREGAVIKCTAIDPSVIDADGIYRKTGAARVFLTEPAAIAAIKAGTIERGDVLVLICRGPAGAGMEETYQLTGLCAILPVGNTSR